MSGGSAIRGLVCASALLVAAAATASGSDVRPTRIVVSTSARTPSDVVSIAGLLTKPVEVALPSALTVRIGSYVETVAAEKLVHNTRRRTLTYRAPKNTTGLRAFTLSLKSGAFSLTSRGVDVGTAESLVAGTAFSLDVGGARSSATYVLAGKRAVKAWKKGGKIRADVVVRVLRVTPSAGAASLSPAAGTAFSTSTGGGLSVVSHDAVVALDGTYRATVETTDASLLSPLDLSSVIRSDAGTTQPGLARVSVGDDGTLDAVAFVETRGGAASLSPTAPDTLTAAGGTMHVPAGAVSSALTGVRFTPYAVLAELPAPAPDGYVALAGAEIRADVEATFVAASAPTVSLARPSWAAKDLLAAADVRLLWFRDGAWLELPGRGEYDAASDAVAPDPASPAKLSGTGAVLYAAKSAPRTTATAKVAGRVLDAQGAPVAGRVVLSRAGAMVTGSDGVFAVEPSALSASSLEVIQAVGDGASAVRVVSAATSDAVDVRVAADAPLVFKVGKVTGVVYEGGATVPAPGATVSFGMASAVKGLTIDAKGTPDNFADDEISVPDLSEFGVQDFSWRLTVPGDATEFTSSVFKGPTVIPSDLILEAQGAGGVVGEGAYTLRVSYSVPTLGEISLYAGFRLSLEGIALVVSDVQLPAAVEATSAVSVVAGADGAYQAFVRAPAGAPMTGRAVRAGGAKEDAQTFQYVSTSPIFTVPLDFVFPLDAPPAIPAGLKHGWNPMPSMPTGRAFARTAVLDGKVWIVGGSDDEETRTTISVFDPMTGTTTPKTSATQGRDRYGGALTAAAAAGRVYAIGGFSLVGGSLASIDAYDPATDAWSPRAPMSVGREAAAVAAVGNKIYVCGGVNGNQGFLTSVEIYDPVAGAWSPGPTMPVSVWTAQFGGGVAVGGKLYVMGHPNYVSEVRTHVLDIATSVWSPLVDYPRAGFSLSFVALHGDLFAVEATNPLDVGFAMSYSRVFDVVSARWGVAPAQAPKLCLVNLAEVAGVVYAVGGAGYYAGGGHSLDVSAYRPAWRSRPRLPTARADAAAAAMSGKVYVAGGRGTAGTTLATLDVFDPSRDLWKPRAAMQGARESFSLVAVNGVVYAIGGFDRATGAALATVEAYVPGLNQWSPRAPMSKPRSGATATVLGGKILVAGGGDDSAEEYDPATDSWTPRASMSSARTSAGGAALGSSAFAFGGAVGGVPTATTEVYDPAEDSWSARGPLTTPRSQAAGAVLDGRPIAIGGVDGAGDVLASVEVFEPSLNQWTTRDALVLPFGRRGAAAAELDGVVYLFGGADAAGAPLRAAMSLEPE